MSEGQRRPERMNLTAVVAWRTLIAAVAWFSALNIVMPDRFTDQIRYFTTLSNFTAALVFTGYLCGLVVRGGTREKPPGWLRGAATFYLVMVFVVYATLLGGDYSGLESFLSHLIVPIIVFIDWIVVGFNQELVAWWMPLAWLLPVFSYLVFYVHQRNDEGGPLYGFLDGDSAFFWLQASLLSVAFLAGGYAVWFIGRLRGRARQRLNRERAVVPGN
jgi:hypothetical protein